MRIYARQVSPEFQESPIFLDGFFPENIAVCGNGEYAERMPDEFKNVKSVLGAGELADMILDFGSRKNRRYSQIYKNITEAITDFLPPKAGKYSTRSIHALAELITAYGENIRRDDEILTAVLSIVTGQKWSFETICGNCQSEWNGIYYPADEWDAESLAEFEAEYFNTGTEWIIDDGEFDPNISSPADICGYSVYCHKYNLDGIRQEIANVANANSNDIILYEFDGYIHSPKYKEV